MFDLLLSYKSKFGNLLVPNDYKDENGNKLGQWVSIQREKKKVMSEYRLQKLNQTDGWIWNVSDFQWEKGYQYLLNFFAENNHFNVPQKFETGGFKLGTWVNGQRNRKEKLSAEKKSKLDALGFVWKIK